MKATGQCPKCGSHSIETKLKQVWPLPSVVGAITVDLYICTDCGFVETYRPVNKKKEKGVV